MPLVAIRASVREVLPWSCLFSKFQFIHQRSTYDMGEYANLQVISIDLAKVVDRCTHISDFIGIALQCDELLGVYDRHFVNDELYSCFDLLICLPENIEDFESSQDETT